MNRRLVVLMAVAILPVAMLAAEVPSVASTDPEVLIARITAGDAPVILDVRTPSEYAEGHVPGALNIPYDELSERLDELGANRATEIVVYCKSGRRSAIAEEVLVDAGFTHVSDLHGHWSGWPGVRETSPGSSP